MKRFENIQFTRYIFAWTIHLFTAMGAVFGFLAIIAIGRHEWLLAFYWMAISVFIDSIDGLFARACKVKEVLPHFDGALLDNIVDYFTYVIVPASFLYETHSVPQKLNLLSAVLITLSSAYQFCQADAKTEDNWFKGFPSYWNIVVFYIFMLDLPKEINFLVIFVLTIGVFIPIRYLYPSRTREYRILNLLLVSMWALLILFSLCTYPNHYNYIYLSLIYVAYYFGYSVYWTYKYMKVRRNVPCE
ncbi:MAG TPA: CDP-alcohol phosphatidyltransferase family protein [Candidatus Hydrogenedens sp.]|nr:CDP-alcohol phosphatidyltransferase family protein [Candidatus Hydrogenedens sp.]